MTLSGGECDTRPVNLPGGAMKKRPVVAVIVAVAALAVIAVR